MPDVVSIAGQDLPASRLALEQAYRAASLNGAFDETVVRLNVNALRC